MSLAFSEIVHDPILTTIQPTKGPIAGKTRITLEGEHLISGVLVKLGQDIVCNYESR